jgi:alkanesulfonate monooxygenase
MGIDVHWTLPTHGDGRSGSQRRWNRGEGERAVRFAPSIRDERGGRFTYADYAVQVARAAELAGFHGLAIPYDPAGEDGWVIGSALARETRHLTIVPEFRPGFASGVYTAKLSFTFQRFFGDRLGWKLDLDGPAADAPVDRLTRAAELLSVAEGVWGETPFDFHGRYFSVESGALFALHAGQQVRVAARPFPTVYAGGEAEERLAFSAAHADVHLFERIETDALRGLIERHRALSERAGRAVRYGLQLSVAAAEYESEAWTKARRLWADVHAGDDGSFESQRVDATAWRGFKQIGHTYDGGLIGSYRDVAERLSAYADLGITTFVLDAIPRVEEAYRLGEAVLPLLAGRSFAGAAS